jgi:hypothetical protein
LGSVGCSCLLFALSLWIVIHALTLLSSVSLRISN